MVVSLNHCSQNGGNLYRAPYYNGNPNIGPRIIGNLDQYPYIPGVCFKGCLGNLFLDPAGLYGKHQGKRFSIMTIGFRL